MRLTRNKPVGPALTLVELLLVIGIIAILAALLSGPVSRAWQKVQHAGWVNKTEVRSERFIDLLEAYFQSHPDSAPMTARALHSAGVIDRDLMDFLNDTRIEYFPFNSRTPRHREILRVDFGEKTFMSSGGVRSWKVRHVIDPAHSTIPKPIEKNSK